MAINKAVFSSASTEWGTPQDFFKIMDLEYGPFDLDVCASKTNAKVKRYFDKAIDGLNRSWKGTCWCNPPYGRDIRRWILKSKQQSKKHGSTVVLLLPARTDTKWFHELVLGQAYIKFIKGRLKFEGAPSSAPFPSMIVVYSPEYSRK